MKPINSLFLFATLAMTAVSANAVDYWFTNNGGNNNFSTVDNWCKTWDGTPIGNTPATTTDDPRIQFQTNSLIIDTPVEIATSYLFFSDKTATVSGSPITVKNLWKKDDKGVDYLVTNVTLAGQVTYPPSVGGKLTINSDFILKSISTTSAVTYSITSGNNNNIIVNSNISLLAETIDSALTKFGDDFLKINWSTTNSAQGQGTGNIYLNGRIDLSRNVGTYYNIARLQVTGRSSAVNPLSNPYVVIGGNDSNNISAIKMENSANVVLAKSNNIMAATQIEARGNNAVTFMHDQQTDFTKYVRAMNSRPNALGDTVDGHTPLYLRLNGTNQVFSYAALELDQWGQDSVNKVGTYQYLQIDFAKGYNPEIAVNSTPSVITFKDEDKGLSLATNIAITNTGVKLETDEAKIANRENAIKSGIILVNFDYESGDRLFLNSDQIMLADAKYYDDITLISTEILDHIWLAEGIKDVDYKLSLELEDLYYSLIVTVIPEPSAYAFLLGGAALMLAYRRRK